MIGRPVTDPASWRRSRPKAGMLTAMVAAAGLAGLVGLAGCANVDESPTGPTGAAQRTDFGPIEQVPPDQRGEPIDLSGTTVDGGQWSRTVDAADQVVVVNVWGSWCPPCVQEMPELQAAWDGYQHAGSPVAFIGVATVESAENSLAFLTSAGVTFPSISDRASDGTPLLALRSVVPGTPTTLILDRDGRVAGRVAGSTTAATLRALIDDVLAETPTAR